MRTIPKCQHPLAVMGHGLIGRIPLSESPSPVIEVSHISSGPPNSDPTIMTLPRQLNETNPVTRLLRLNRERRTSTDGIHDIFVEAQPSAWNCRVSGTVCLRYCVICCSGGICRRAGCLWQQIAGIRSAGQEAV